MSEIFERLCAWENLLDAQRKAARGKRGQRAAARFEFALADRLLELKRELESGQYRPGGYVNFFIHEPKRRKISAAPFRDRVVHHALCNVIEPRFERLFIPDSYANRAGKGTHRAIDRLQPVLWAWKRAIVERLARLRLTIHERPAQVLPVDNGIPWLGFVVFPAYRRVKARKVRSATSRLGERLDDYRAGRISFAELDVSVKAWVNHVRYADTWGLRRHVFSGLRFSRVPTGSPGATRP